eukprot:Phypoly_transcript_06417.p1 GENE.Phypoly_transcript_06417~~Phypoly_transcript_06417.p1  ORF type:complete len:284 (+),score=58.28 Phypoly_transcript_06417:79-930(+)
MGINQSADKQISPPPSPHPHNISPTLLINSKGPSAIPIPNKVSAFSPITPPRGELRANEVNVLMSPPGSPSSLRMHGGPPPTLIPTVFTWTGGGKDVYITGGFNNWKEKIPLNLSEKDFTLIQYLPPGTYQYKFIVDGKWVHAPDQPIQTDLKGNVNNFLEVKPADRTEELASILSTPQGSPPGAYSTTIPGPDFQKVPPPSLPPHLQRALLNIAPSTVDPTILPLPHHVMLNHFYSLERDNVTILGVTHRYRNKFVTTVLYKPAPTENSLEKDDDFIEDIEL